MTTNDKINILMIDDDEDDFFLVRTLLEDISPDQYVLQWASSYQEGLTVIETRSHDLYLVDYRLGQYTGIDMLHYFRSLGYNAPVILLTGKGDYRIDKEAMAAGASDYVVKGEINAALLERAIRYTLDKFNHLTAIAKSEKRYFNIFDKSNDIILLADAGCRIVAANPAAQKALRYDEEDLYRHHLSDLFAIPEQGAQLVQQLQSGAVVSQQEYTLNNRSGQPLDVMLNASVLDEKKQLFLCIIQDMTARKRKEKEKQQQEKFSITGRIARLIAHEVRNPLTNILLAITQLKDEPPAATPPGELYLDIMERNCHRINQLVTELLQSTRMLELDLRPMPVNTLVQQALQMAADRLQLNQIRVQQELITPGVQIMADEEKMMYALLNVIINAVEAMTPGAGVLDVRTWQDNGHVYIQIADNGTGIREEDLAKLFEPFFTSKTKGTGLGLTTTQNIVLNHKGNIVVESEPGKGTRVIIGFPWTGSRTEI